MNFPVAAQLRELLSGALRIVQFFFVMWMPAGAALVLTGVWVLARRR